MPDRVNHPKHYTAGGLEAIRVLEAKLTPEEFRGFLRGNVLKYVMRASYKGAEGQDYRKAAWYLDELIRRLPRSRSSRGKRA